MGQHCQRTNNHSMIRSGEFQSNKLLSNFIRARILQITNLIKLSGYIYEQLTCYFCKGCLEDLLKWDTA